MLERTLFFCGIYLLGLAVLYEEHSHKGEDNEYRSERKEGIAHTEDIVKNTRKYGGNDLRRHREGVVKSGVFANVRAAAHFHNHWEGVYVYCRPANAYKTENQVPIIELQTNRALMNLHLTTSLDTLLNYEITFGILPYPMFDEQQKDVGYMSTNYDTYITLPSYMRNEAMITECIELLSYYSYDVREAHSHTQTA